MPTSDSYHNALIESLKDPKYAAVYLETHLEEDEDEFDPELLKLAFSHVLEALGEANLTPEQAKLHYEKLNELFAQRGIDAIYGLTTLLNLLGLKLTVTVAEKSRINNQTALAS